jgi:sensitive to high expression protein 9
MHALMDKTMASLTLASQRINNYTGTDYSAIEALRREITEQEQLVKARYAAVQASKTALDEAQEMRTTSATELVALLERKHSWTASDLEKYMSLVRSEHANDRAVQTAKDAVLAAEQSLEESRIRLEKRERAQYHEEQIWSDTIRRNSTWVTMGLMGLNIGILLFNLVVIEPWRRRRLVVEVRKALAEKNLASPALVEQVRKGVLHDLEEQPNSVEENVEVPTVDLIVPEIFVAVSPVETMETVAMVEAIETVEAVETVESTKSELLSSWNNRAEAYIRSLFSDNLVSLRKIDMTTIVLQSAAAGASLAGLIIVVIAKPR